MDAKPDTQNLKEVRFNLAHIIRKFSSWSACPNSEHRGNRHGGTKLLEHDTQVAEQENRAGRKP